MRKKIVAGNWKMNNDLTATNILISELIKKEKITDAEVMIAPAFVNLLEASKLLKYSSIIVAAQNMHFAENGAYTGEISAAMLKSIGVNTVILGHSERREYFNEDDNLLKQKVDKALEERMKIIFCFGEKWEDRSVDNHFIVVENQIKNALFHLENENWESIVLAYEPVWAIGTGIIPKPKELFKTVEFIKSKFKAKKPKILYGGSVNPKNIKDLKEINNIDGFLIGGASQNVNKFIDIVKKTYS